MADNEGLGTLDTHVWRNRRPFRPLVLSPSSHFLWWAMLIVWGGLIGVSLVAPGKSTNWLLCSMGFTAAAANVGRDVAGRSRRARIKRSAHGVQGVR